MMPAILFVHIYAYNIGLKGGPHALQVNPSKSQGSGGAWKKAAKPSAGGRGQAATRARGPGPAPRAFARLHSRFLSLHAAATPTRIVPGRGDLWRCRRDGAPGGRAPPRVANLGPAAWRSSASSSTASRPTGSSRSPSACTVRLPLAQSSPLASSMPASVLHGNSICMVVWFAFPFGNAVVNMSGGDAAITRNGSVSFFF